MKALENYIGFTKKILYWNIDPLRDFTIKTLAEYYEGVLKSIVNQCL